MLKKRSVVSMLFVGVSACGGSILHKRPRNRGVDRAVTELWAAEIRDVGRTGDWLLSRSYSFPGDVISVGTRGEDLSHAALYDAERGLVIEAVTPEVREIPLEKFLHRNRYAILLRPAASEQARRESIGRARSLVGAKFDYTGMFGLDNRSRFYCTELVVWALGIPRPSTVISPSELFQFGEVVYFSGARDWLQIQEIAADFVGERSTV